MRMISWNLNGLLSTIENGSFGAIGKLNPDFLCMQEIRTEKEPTVLKGYRHRFRLIRALRTLRGD